MSTYGVAGSVPLADIPKDIEDMVLDLIVANWNLTGLNIEDIEQGTGWKDGIKKKYAIHCTHVNTLINPKDVPHRMHDFDIMVGIHVFQMRTGIDKQDEIGTMVREVTRILIQNKTALGSSVRLVAPRTWRNADDPELEKITYWHRVAEARVYYTTADIS